MPGSRVVWGAPEIAGEVLGLLQDDPEHFLQSSDTSSDAVDRDVIEAIVRERNDARASKNYALADQKRDELTSLGIVLEDGPEGTTWRRED